MCYAGFVFTVVVLEALYQCKHCISVNSFYIFLISQCEKSSSLLLVQVLHCHKAAVCP